MIAPCSQIETTLQKSAYFPDAEYVSMIMKNAKISQGVIKGEGI